MAGAGVHSLTRDLCRFASGVVSPENDGLFSRIGEELPLELHRFASGSEHNGWLVPELWSVQRASIRRDGRELYDAASHPLGVAAYSRAFTGELDLEQLRQHLVTNQDLPEALVYHCMWQYRPWDADWAISMPYELYRTLEPGRYEVELETTYEPGEMLVATYEHAGSTDRTIVLNAHTCHPRMANDDFAGVAVLIRLFQWLRDRETHYTYRLVLGPEHLGTVFYLRDRPEEEVARMVGGAFCEMPGTQGPVKVASSFLGAQAVDRAFRHAATQLATAHAFVPWRSGAGNDETVWEAPGYEVPFVEVSRSEDLLAPYREYHTSLDTAELMDPDRLGEFLRVFQGAVEILEDNAVPVRRFDGLVCLSNPAYDLYPERPDPAVDKQLGEDSERWGYLSDCLPRYLDGSMTLLDIAERHELPFWELRDYMRQWEAKDLIRLERATIERVPAVRMREAPADA